MASASQYFVGVVLFTGALAYAAHLAGVSAIAIAVGALMLIGLGLMKGISRRVDRRAPRPPAGGRRPGLRARLAARARAWMQQRTLEQR